MEKQKIRSAILTDFILSVEIIIIALGVVTEKALAVQILVVTFVAIVATVGVYGVVALIVRMDDVGLRFIALSDGDKNGFYYVGKGLVRALPKVVKGLSIIGIIALLLVSGGIFVHQIEVLHHVLEVLPELIRDFLVGLAVGVLMLGLVKVVKWGIRKIF